MKRRGFLKSLFGSAIAAPLASVAMKPEAGASLEGLAAKVTPLEAVEGISLAQPPTVINISAIDTQSFADAVQKNHMAIASAVAKALQFNNGALLREVARAARFS